MSYRIMARNDETRTGVAKATAAEALTALEDLLRGGFELTAVIDDDGDNVPVERLASLANEEA